MKVEVHHEEIITHPVAWLDSGIWNGEARVAGSLMIDGRNYEFNEVVEVRLHPKSPNPNGGE
jgi:hypothetical protein